jgi:hypothetical protein
MGFADLSSIMRQNEQLCVSLVVIASISRREFGEYD